MEGGERDDDQAVPDGGSAAFELQDPMRIGAGPDGADERQVLPNPFEELGFPVGDDG
jgi:hypothetical protein